MKLTVSDLDLFAGMPRDCSEPIFQEPWEAQLFAMVVYLHEKGIFTWQEWTERLSRVTHRAQAAGDSDFGDTYYRHWLTAFEDLIAEKNSTSPAKDIKFMDFLVSQKVSGTKSSWRMGSCTKGTSQTGSFTNTADNKFKKWDDRFSKRRIKCKGSQDIKYLKVFDICNNGAAGNNCTYNNTQRYKGQLGGQGTGIYEKWYLGKMEVNMNNGSKKKYLYFQIH